MNWIKRLFKKQTIVEQQTQALNIPVVTFSVASSDVGKCTKCKFNINDRCTVGTYYAEQGKSRFCIGGELWEANTHNVPSVNVSKLKL